MNPRPPEPGEFVVDELGRIIMSYSSVKLFRSCRKKYKHRILDQLVPLDVRAGDPRNLGKAVHGGVESLRKEENADDTVLEHWGDVSGDHDAYEQCERSRAMLRGYRGRWHSDERQADFHWRVELLETRFTGDIINPTDGRVHQRFSIGGKVDGVVVVLRPCLWGLTPIEPGVYLNEVKTAARIDGMYLSRLFTDFQILLYAWYVADALGVELKGVLYDIIGKPKMDHREGETQGEFDARIEELKDKIASGEISKSAKGGTVKQRKDETEDAFEARRIKGSMEWIGTIKRIERETDESFRERLDSTCSGENMYHREVVPIIPAHVEDIRVELWETLIQHEEAESRNRWGKNEASCFDFHRACDYWSICKSLDSQHVIEENYRRKLPHTEQAENPHLPIVD